MADELCGEVIDHYPAMPGNVVSVCARPPHTSRAWHKNEDGSIAWKTKKIAKKDNSVK